MMILRNGKTRGFINQGWLKSYHSFSFAEYYDPNFMKFSALRVLNEDFIAKKGSFPMHPHRDMEIITFIVSGAVTHVDNLGNRMKVSANEIQVMRAGRGIIHSESNEEAEELHLYQIWIVPKNKNLTPKYFNFNYKDLKVVNNERTIFSPSDGVIDNDVGLSLFEWKSSTQIQRELDVNRSYYLQVVTGEIKTTSDTLIAGDALMIQKESLLPIYLGGEGLALLFSLP